MVPRWPFGGLFVPVAVALYHCLGDLSWHNRVSSLTHPRRLPRCVLQAPRRQSTARKHFVIHRQPWHNDSGVEALESTSVRPAWPATGTEARLLLLLLLRLQSATTATTTNRTTTTTTIEASISFPAGSPGCSVPGPPGSGQARWSSWSQTERS